MILDCAQYTGPCPCGRTHTLTTRQVVIAPGALADFGAYMATSPRTRRSS